jgi:hypothetical protein
VSHEYNLPFQQFERYSLALIIIAKQNELIKELKHSKKDQSKISEMELAIKVMIDKLNEESEESDGLETFILNTNINQ